MKTHKQLKEICDLIEHDSNKFIIRKANWVIYKLFWLDKIPIDVRELIYTTDFMDKFVNHLCTLEFFNKKWWPHEAFWDYNDWKKNWKLIIIGNIDLDNPTQYLHKLLLWNK